MDVFCQIADREPFFLITDLDNANCAPSLVREWIGGIIKPHNLIFRVASSEIESWLLADWMGMVSLLGRKVEGRLPGDSDVLPDAKRTLLSLAEKASREVRLDLVVRADNVASQGLGYNNRLIHFVQNIWNPEAASQRSDSLRRARMNLMSFFNELEG